MSMMLEHDIVIQSGNDIRNRIWIHKSIGQT